MHNLPSIELIVATPNYEEIKKNYLGELNNAAYGRTSSLSYIKHYLPEKPIVTSGIVQSIVIGGTNYIISTDEILADGLRNNLVHKTGVLPIIHSDQTLFSFLDEHLDGRATALGVNFGFPLEPVIGQHGELDGKLLTGTKEHAMIGLVGKTLGHEIGSFFEDKFGSDIPVAIANDTVCLTLAGTGDENGSMIDGTGFNIGIKTLEDNKSVVINFEAANFNNFEPSDVLKKIDAESVNPGVNLFEKAISGRYLAEYFNEIADTMHLDINRLKTSQELSELSHKDHTDIIGDLARAILQRAASLAATAVAAVYEFCGKPGTFTLISEGSTLWDGWNYLENLQKQLEELGVPSHAIVFKRIPDSSVKGALGLLTK